MMFLPGIIISVFSAACGLFVTFSGYAKWPRLTGVLSGMILGATLCMCALAVIL